MRYVYLTLLFCSSLSLYAQNMTWPGYIVSKNGKKLNGEIGAINHQARTSTVIFINGFGNVYELEAERIKGFVFEVDSCAIIFESKTLPQSHRFLRAMHKNGPMELFVLTYDSDYQWQNVPVEQRSYWVRLQGQEDMVKITRLNFRQKMRSLIQEKAPGLAIRIGEKDFRFDNMYTIVNRYNKLLAPKPKAFEI